jgi:hypothetical protein
MKGPAAAGGDELRYAASHLAPSLCGGRALNWSHPHRSCTRTRVEEGALDEADEGEGRPEALSPAPSLFARPPRAVDRLGALARVAPRRPCSPLRSRLGRTHTSHGGPRERRRRRRRAGGEMVAAGRRGRWGGGGGSDGRWGRELGFGVAARGWRYKAWVGVVGGFFCKSI